MLSYLVDNKFLLLCHVDNNFLLSYPSITLFCYQNRGNYSQFYKFSTKEKRGKTLYLVQHRLVSWYLDREIEKGIKSKINALIINI